MGEQGWAGSHAEGGGVLQVKLQRFMGGVQNLEGFEPFRGILMGVI